MIIFYDGSCRFCVRQAERLKRWDKKGALELIDLQQDKMTCGLYGIHFLRAIEEIHGTNGLDIFVGADLIREVLREIGWTKTYWLLALPGIRQLFSLSFNLLSRFRRYL